MYCRRGAPSLSSPAPRSYAHPLEETLVNFGSTAIGPMLFPPSHLLVWLLWFALRLHETVARPEHNPRPALFGAHS